MSAVNSNDQNHNGFTKQFSNYTDKTWDKIYNFINGPMCTADYGYREHPMVGIGSVLLNPASFAINLWSDSKRSTVKKVTAVAIGIITSPITLLGATIKSLGLAMPIWIGKMTSDQINQSKFASPQRVDQIYSLVAIFNEVCQENGIKYFAEAGSLLGAYREGGMIKWDDDFDAGIMIEEKAKIQGLKQEFANRGVLLEDRGDLGFPDVFNLSLTDAKMQELGIDLLGEKKSMMDLFVYDIFDGQVRYRNVQSRNQFSRWYFASESVNELEFVNFGPKIPNGFKNSGQQLQVPVVKKEAAEETLKRYYGDDCLKYGIQTHNHTSFFGVPVPIPNFSRAKYAVVMTPATGNLWK